MFTVDVGCLYNRVRIDLSKVSSDAEYFKNYIDSIKLDGNMFIITKSSSEIVVWCQEDIGCRNIMERMCNLGISFSYEYTEVTQKHVDRIELGQS